jgi:hypothetical protein
MAHSFIAPTARDSTSQRPSRHTTPYLRRTGAARPSEFPLASEPLRARSGYAGGGAQNDSTADPKEWTP